jgi:hypothetical protein
MRSSARWQHAAIALQPLAFGVGATLSRFVQWPMPAGDLPRPLIIVAVLSMAAWAVAYLVSRSAPWAAIAASAFILLGLREPLPGGVLAAIAIWMLLITVLRRAQSRPAVPQWRAWTIARATGIFGVAFAGMMAFTAWQAHTAGIPDADYPEYVLAGTETPNIYLILLDGYPSPDTLKTTFDIDIGPFLGGLEDLGFSVAKEARSNYSNTWLTMASMLNGAYVDEFLPGDIPADPDAQTRWLQSAIQESAVVKALADHGYTVRSTRTPVGSTGLTEGTKVLNAGGITDFEVNLLVESPWMLPMSTPIGNWLLSAKETDVRDALRRTAEEGKHAGPHLQVTAIQSPHPPFALGFTERRASLPGCYPACPLWSPTMEELEMGLGEYQQRLGIEIRELNELVLSSVRDLIAADPNGVVIIFSDHGLRYSFADPDEFFQTLLVTRTPGRPALFPDDESPVNLMRTVMRAYFEAPVDRVPYRAWSVDWGAPLNLAPLTLNEAY